MDKIGRYRVERRIGAGSFATVWFGHDDELDVPVAVKVLAENWAGNDDVRNRFLSEARIMRRIHDPRLVQVYDIGTLADGRPYFVMDYIDGGSLNDLRTAGIEPARALRLCADACRAIELLHANDIIHRDVTPGNLLLRNRPGGAVEVVVADLGVAKSMIDVAGQTMTAGTPSYMAPEQAAGQVPLDRRVDVYSLTAVTYAMLTGRPPFRVTSIADIIGRDPGLRPEPLAAQLNAPPSLDAVLGSGLAYDRNLRPPTALLLAGGLDAIANQLATGGIGSTAVPGGAPSTTPAPPQPLPIQPIQPSPVQPSRPEAQATLLHGSLPPSGPPSGPPAQIQPTPATALTPAYGGQPFFGPSAAEPGQQTVPGYDPYGPSVIQPPPPPPQPAPRRRGSYALMLGLGALALFAISMFVTILLIN